MNILLFSVPETQSIQCFTLPECFIIRLSEKVVDKKKAALSGFVVSIRYSNGEKRCT
ncbi:MAG: hypothetical protein JW913_13450 [Chitinispirillaceae bacterium]|nr:hypothetical protein [Chitinispirillaceae bacterium]